MDTFILTPDPPHYALISSILIDRGLFRKETAVKVSRETNYTRVTGTEFSLITKQEFTENTEL